MTLKKNIFLSVLFLLSTLSASFLYAQEVKHNQAEKIVEALTAQPSALVNYVCNSTGKRYATKEACEKDCNGSCFAE